MKKRYIYSLLFGVPGIFFALIISFMIFGMSAGILWISVFGDNPWPPAAENALLSLAVVCFALFWMSFIVAGFLTGKKLENDATLNKRHILISVCLSIAPCLIFILYQSGIGNLGEKSDSRLCSDYCQEYGFAASGMPPRESGIRECRCYDISGQAVKTVPLDEISRKTKP